MRISKVKEDILLSRMLTRKGGVLTTEGIIPHRKHPKYGFEMPVLTQLNGPDPKFPPVPVRHPTTGVLVFAMPGGGAWYPNL